jgi:hypothetical protein
MTEPTARRRVNAEDLAIPRWNLVEELIEGLGRAAADLFPHEPVDAQPKPGVKPPGGGSPPAEQPVRGVPAVLRFPRIDDDIPLGPSPDNPMGEGSEQTALPVIDPVDAREGHLRSAPEPLP